jgi:hypothetical protein
MNAYTANKMTSASTVTEGHVGSDDHPGRDQDAACGQGRA